MNALFDDDMALHAAALARADAHQVEDVIHRLQIEADARAMWHGQPGLRTHHFVLGPRGVASAISRADAAWRWATIILPQGHPAVLLAVLRRIEHAPPSARVDALRQAADDTGGWWRDNPGATTMPRVEIDCCGITALGDSAQDAARAWLRQAREVAA